MCHELLTPEEACLFFTDRAVPARLEGDVVVLPETPAAHAMAGLFAGMQNQFDLQNSRTLRFDYARPLVERYHILLEPADWQPQLFLIERRGKDCYYRWLPDVIECPPDTRYVQAPELQPGSMAAMVHALDAAHPCA